MPTPSTTTVTCPASTGTVVCSRSVSTVSAMARATSCGRSSKPTVTVPTSGELRTFSIVAFAAPGVEVPFVAGVVDCGGTSVRTNIINVEPVPENIHTGMKVQLATYSLGTDSEGVEAVGFGYEPIG